MKAETPITPEALIELGFEKMAGNYFTILKSSVEIFVGHKTEIVFISSVQTNATTMEDIKDLIRLFK